MRRSVRSLCVLIFVAGVVVVLNGALGAPLRILPGRTDAEVRRAKGIGLALQGAGAVGYLAVVTLWRRRS